VSIAITVMLIAASVPIFNEERGKNLVPKEAQLIAAYIEGARSMAQHPESENAVGYRVTSIDNNTITTLRLEYESETIVEKEEVRTPLTLTRSTADFGSNTFDFYVFAGEYRGPSDEITIHLISNPGITKKIVVSKPGAINVVE
jgi:hypothetical protein